MSRTESYDFVILGCGESGKHLAWTAGKTGKKTAVIERNQLGGSCPNVACLPSKNVIYSAKVFNLVQRSHEFGITTGPVSLDMSGVRERKRKMVRAHKRIHEQLFSESGAETIFGEGRFIEPRVIEIQLRDGGTRRLTAELLFLNLGSRASMPRIPGLMEAKPLTHVEALELGRLPEHLIVLGGGYVGIELGQAFRRFGSRVTVIERGPKILSQEDPDVSDEMLRLLGDEGLSVLLDSQVTKVEGLSGKEVEVQIQGRNGVRALRGSDLLVALGRDPNTQGIGLDIAQVALDQRGYIRVNDRLETSAPGIWALGDCVGRPFFTHIAYDDYRIVWNNLSGGNSSTRGRQVPYCVFTDPPLAHVGIRERDVRAAGLDYRVFQAPIEVVLRTWTVSEPRGFMKMLVDARDDRILGFTVLGYEAGELMAVVQTAMIGGMPWTALRDAIFTHPTMAEGLGPLLSGKPEARAALPVLQAA